jgi:uncharacterized protein
LFDGVVVGFVGGFTSGLLGVSLGGGLIVFSILLLGVEQHAAQGVSLVAQVFPTSLSGIRRYWQKGHRAPVMWLVLLGGGFLVGGAAGAKAAAVVSRVFLRWTFVLYLVALGAVVVARPRRQKVESADAPAARSVAGRAHRCWRVRGLLVRISRHRRGIGHHRRVERLAESPPAWRKWSASRSW